MIMKYANQLVEKLRARGSKNTVDLNSYFEWVRRYAASNNHFLISKLQTTMDLIADLLCGQPEGALEKEDGGFWLNILSNVYQGQVLYILLPPFASLILTDRFQIPSPRNLRLSKMARVYSPKDKSHSTIPKFQNHRFKIRCSPFFYQRNPPD